MFLSLSHLIDNQPLPQTGHRKRLVKTDENIKLISNICPHQRSRLELTGSTITCPYHAWSFKLDGTCLGSGNTECKNDKNLEEFLVFQVGNFLFDTSIDLPNLDFLDNDNLVLMEQRIDKVNAPKEVIMDLFLDVGHIPFVHKGVYDQIGISNPQVEWFYTHNASLQVVDNGKAFWLALYPGTMIEYQKGAIFITIAESNNVHVFKYKDTRYENLWKLNESVWETAWEQDKKQAEMIDGINVDNLEPSKQHYVNWCRR